MSSNKEKIALSNGETFEIEIDIARVITGDVVVFKCNKKLTQEDKAFTCKQMMKLFPNNEVMVLDEGCDIWIERDI